MKVIQGEGERRFDTFVTLGRSVFLSSSPSLFLTSIPNTLFSLTSFFFCPLFFSLSSFSSSLRILCSGFELSHSHKPNVSLLTRQFFASFSPSQSHVSKYQLERKRKQKTRVKVKEFSSSYLCSHYPGKFNSISACSVSLTQNSRILFYSAFQVSCSFSSYSSISFFSQHFSLFFPFILASIQ